MTKQDPLNSAAVSPSVAVTKTLISSAKFWMSFPFTYLVYSTLVMGLGPEDILKIVLNPFYWFVCVISVFAGHGLLRIKWYGWYLFIFSNLLVFYETASILTYYSRNENRLQIFLATMLFQLCLMYIVAREVRVPYFFPRIRWWESDPRYKLSVPVRLYKQDGQDIEGEIMDISLGGCFIKTHSYFAHDEDVSLEFNIFDRLMKCKGRVVWRTESKVTHPKGIGVKFDVLAKETVGILKKAQKKLTQLNRMYQQISAERNWEEYLRREKRFQGTPTHAEGTQPTKEALNTNEQKKKK